jgi:hypothetical protein
MERERQARADTPMRGNRLDHGRTATIRRPKAASPSRVRTGSDPRQGTVARPGRESGDFAEARLLTHWEEIVGEDVAGIALPLKITYGRGFGGTLVLLTTGAHAPVLEMQRQSRSSRRVNACYGYRAVVRVQVTQTAPTGFAEGQVAFRTAARQNAGGRTRPQASGAGDRRVGRNRKRGPPRCAGSTGAQGGHTLDEPQRFGG